MNQGDIDKLVEALSIQREQQREKDKWVDWLFKALIGLLVYFGLEMKKDVSEIKDQQTELAKIVLLNQQSVNGLNGSLGDLQSFTSKPRFTAEDFLEKTTPLINSINKNSIQIQQNEQNIQSLTERVLQLEFIQENSKK